MSTEHPRWTAYRIGILGDTYWDQLRRESMVPPEDTPLWVLCPGNCDHPEDPLFVLSA